MSKELDVVRGLKKATEEGRVAWKKLARAGLVGGERFLGSLETGRSFLLQGPGPLAATECLLEIRDVFDNVEYTIQESPVNAPQVGTSLRELYTLVAQRAEAVLDETLEELGAKASS